MKKSFAFLLLLSILWGCAPKQYSAITLPETEYVELDTLEVTAPKPSEYDVADEAIAATLPTYNPSHKRENDLLHTKLDLRFDWAKEQVLGKATLTLKPYFYAADKVTLDAKGFEFHKVVFEGSSEPLKYDYDGLQATIHLGKKLTRAQEYKLAIEYTATPAASGGSAAITSDKGLFFINPKGEEADKPQQIWTQGETENNSRWFPTIDKPNERATNEIYVTVEDRFKTLSNGTLVSSTKNPDGTRTDYWNMDMPHAPYLVMLAIGEYAVVEDTWNGKKVQYYVEPKFEKHARDIFPHTPEMLQFFSDKLGVPYPWQKFAQVVVRDYVSGAMENTTAVIFGEFMQGTARSLEGNLQNENVVAHEMFHHWFGDYVTCESWANLTLNEGFANYSEYLWLEHKYGKEEADLHRYQEMQGYMQSAQQGTHPLIHFGHADKEEMFDAHSYNKGGLILHLLRKHVGDEAFFAALNLYLTRNALTDVEAHELRLAFEDVTGEDLNWFFNQWFFSEGQPELNIDYNYDEQTKQVTVNVEQIQDPKKMPAIFEIPVAIDIYAGGKVERQNVRINQRKQTFSFDAAQGPDLVVFDGDGVLLAKLNEQKSLDENIFQFEHVPNVLHRIEALGQLSESEDPRVEALFKNALNDRFWLMRVFALNSMEMTDDLGEAVARLAQSDPNSDVRQAAILKLAESSDAQYIPLLDKAIESDQSMKVVSAALDALMQLDKDAALAAAKKLEKEDDEGIIVALSGMYAEAGDPQLLSFFEDNFDKVGGFAQFEFLNNYTTLASSADAETMVGAAKKMEKIATNASKLYWFRFAATKGINTLHGVLAQKIGEESDAAVKTSLKMKDAELVSLIEGIKTWEKDGKVIEMYKNFPDPALKP